MAVEKALFTSQNDFATPLGIGPLSGDPFLRFDGEGIPSGWELIGTAIPEADKVGGVYGKAIKFNKVRTIRKKDVIFPASNRRMISLWYKPTAGDFAKQWSILSTTRGSGYGANFGMHLAMNKDTTTSKKWLYYRVIGTNDAGAESSVEGYSNGSGPDKVSFEFVQDQWHHICIFYDYDWATKTPTVNQYPIEVYVNKQRIFYAGVVPNVTQAFTRTYSVGDMPTATAVSTNATEGVIDESIWENGDRVWTIAQMNAYYDAVVSADYLDNWTEPGSLILGKSPFTNQYTPSIKTWTSPSINLGLEGFGDFGRVQVNFEKPTNTGINILTRSSVNGSVWNSWIAVGEDGMIHSPDNPFLQVKTELYTIDPLVTPKIMEVQILDYPKKKRLTLTSEPLIIYRDLDTGMERLGELRDAYDIYIIEEINGEETLEFKMATNDPKRLELGSEAVELIAQIGDKRFIIRNPIDKRDDSGKKYTEFFAEAMWYELRDAKVITFESIEQNVQTTIQAILDASIEPTGWTFYKTNITIKRTIRGEWKSVLELLHEVRDQFGGELQFDTVDRTISLISKIGEDNGVRFYYNKNLKTIERSVDTYNLITRLYLYGKNDMTIKSVNNNVEYLENTTWVDALGLRKRIRIDRWSDGRYTIPQNLKDDGQKMLNEWSKPNVGYAMTVNDLSVLSGHEHESIGLGDTVYAVDTELLNLLIDSRIMRRKYNVRQPWKTEVELNQPKKELADANQRNIDDAVELLVENDPLDTTDVQQMTVFNHLLNSRAEDGMKYWEESGTGISNEIGGFSGDSSWKVIGGYGVTNIMKQSIFGVSHRSAYTVSAYVGNEGTITRGPTNDAFVGIRVRIHYTEADTDGKTYEDHYLAIPDITQGGA